MARARAVQTRPETLAAGMGWGEASPCGRGLSFPASSIGAGYCSRGSTEGQGLGEGRGGEAAVAEGARAHCRALGAAGASVPRAAGPLSPSPWGLGSPYSLSRWGSGCSSLSALKHQPRLLFPVQTTGGVSCPLLPLDGLCPQAPAQPPSPAWLPPGWVGVEGASAAVNIPDLQFRGENPAACWANNGAPLPTPTPTPSCSALGPGSGSAGISRKCSFSI